ncbi:MAG: NAD-dependent epimerase/dehydratase family protein [Burkholderiales bacterium]
MTGALLVTGGYGFIGRNVARRFAQAGWTVSGIGHGAWSEPEFRDWGFKTWHTADVTLQNLLASGGEPDVIVHCAGASSVGYSIEHPLEDFERSVATTAAVLEFARRWALRARIVLPSSGAVYGAARSLPIAETAALNPVSPYGAHKRIAEELCRMYGAQFGIASCVIRFFSAYGEGLRKQLLWDACRRLSAGQHYFGGTGKEVRDWLHVSDVASLALLAHEAASANCPTLNGGTGIGVAVSQLLAEIYAAFGVTGAPRFSGEPRRGDPAAYVADISAAAKLGWQPAVSWKQGVHAYVSWFKGLADVRRA